MRRRDWMINVSAAGAIPVPAALAQAPKPARSAERERMLTPAQRRERFHQNLTARGEAIARNQFRGITSRREWESARPQFLTDLRSELGLASGPRKDPLHAKVSSRFERDGYSVENIVFQSLPGMYVTGNLYIPTKRPSGGAPVVIYVCGHSPSPLGAKIGYQHH